MYLIKRILDIYYNIIFKDMIKMNFNTVAQRYAMYKPVESVQMITPQTRTIIPVAEPVYREPPSKKITWGEPTWFLFHTLAHKVKEFSFAQVKTELLNIIFLICNNLPCPDCANHATRYLQGINFDAIKTKEQLKEMLFTFHNSVNMRKGYAIFPRDDLDGKYDSAITVNIINNFYYHFDKSSHNQKMAANGFHRTRTVQRMKTWLSNNARNFDP